MRTRPGANHGESSVNITDTIFTLGWGIVAGICAIVLLILTWLFSFVDEIRKL